MPKKMRSTGDHPLAHIVLAMAEQGQMIDVTTVAAALSGAPHGFLDDHKGKVRNAYRVVAADVLGCMADCEVLTQSRPYPHPTRPEDGGPFFAVA